MFVREDYLQWSAALAIRQWLEVTDPNVEVATAIGVRTAEVELRVKGLFDPRAQLFSQQFPYTALQGVGSELAEDVRGVLVEGTRQGLNERAVVPLLRERFRVKRSRLASIARTEMNRSANYGRWSGWKQSGLVRQKEYVATLDDRVRVGHLQADGEVVGVDDAFSRGDAAGFLMPPIDVNCRCTAAPRTALSEPDFGREAQVERLIEKNQANMGACDVHRIGLEATQESMPGLYRQEQRYERDLMRVLMDWENRLILEVESKRLSHAPLEIF